MAAAGGGGDAGDPAGDDQETGQAVQAPLKGRREAFQDAAPEAGSSLQLQAEVKRLKTSVHQLEDSLAVHKEYCTGIFEGLFSTLKERESARYGGCCTINHGASKQGCRGSFIGPMLKTHTGVACFNVTFS